VAPPLSDPLCRRRAQKSLARGPGLAAYLLLQQ